MYALIRSHNYNVLVFIFGHLYRLTIYIANFVYDEQPKINNTDFSIVFHCRRHKGYGYYGCEF